MPNPTPSGGPAPSGALPAPDARARRVARAVFAGILALLALWVARPYLVALVWATVIAIAVWPLYVRLAGRSGGSVLAPLAVTLASALAIAAPLAFVTVEIGREGQAVLAWMSEAQQNGIAVPGWIARLPLLGEHLDRWWREHLTDPQGAGALLGGFDREALSRWVQAFGGEFLRRLFLAALALMGLFVLLRDGETLATRLLEVVDRWLGAPGERLAEKMVDAVRGTVNGTVLVALGEGALIGIAYGLAGVPHPVLFAILTAAVAMVPFGAWAAFTAAALLLLGQDGNTLAAAAVFGWGALVMLAGDNFVQPALIGGAARLPFLPALIGIFGGVEAFGLVGLFIGPVIMAALLTIWREWLVAGPSGTSGARP